MLILGIGLICVCKPNASCDKCHDQKMKCKYPGKTSIRVGSGMGVGSPTKGWPIIVVPSPKHKSLEVRCQEVAVWAGRAGLTGASPRGRGRRRSNLKWGGMQGT